MTTAGGLITPINLNDTTAQTCNPHAEPPPTPAANCRYALAQLLVQHGADPTAKNNEDKTPADLANCLGRQRVFKRLLAAGAGP
ncbi:MAG: hypothetical protein QW086_04385 [Pyrobaculum sp.]